MPTEGKKQAIRMCPECDEYRMSDEWMALEVSNAALVEALEQARLQIAYLNEKYPTTSTGIAALARIDHALAKVAR